MSTIDELFARTLTGDYDDDVPWKAVRDLHMMGTREILEKASRWCMSTNELERARGADVLAQLGKTGGEHPENAFPEEVFAALAALVKVETEARPLASALYAFGHLDDSRAIAVLIPFASYPDPNVRHAVAFSLGQFANDQRSLVTLLQLTEDPDEEVRDWATFSIGISELDSTEIRETLVRRLTDSDDTVREEAISGLGKRNDRRALPHLLKGLLESDPSYCVLEGAAHMLGMKETRKDWKPADYAKALREQFATTD